MVACVPLNDALSAVLILPVTSRTPVPVKAGCVEVAELIPVAIV